MYEVANTTTSTNSSWYLTKNKGILGHKPVNADKIEFYRNRDRS